ncbi:hypothetical protein LCGC14_0883570, partial [marine sediment metagenome]
MNVTDVLKAKDDFLSFCRKLKLIAMTP